MHMSNFVDIGFSNFVEAEKILTVSKPGSAPIKRVIQNAKESNRFLDLTEGKKTRSIITQASYSGVVIVASSIQPSTIKERLKRSKSGRNVVEKISDDIIEVTVE